MTEHCHQDDRLLDYLYEEMTEKERASYSAHVVSCEKCQPALQEFQRVREVVHLLPGFDHNPIDDGMVEPALAALTKRILQEANQALAAPGAASAPAPGNQVSADPPEVIPLADYALRRQRQGAASLKKVLLHPAFGILAVAAAALIVVLNLPKGRPDAPPIAEKPETSATRAGAGGVAAAPQKVAVAPSPSTLERPLEPLPLAEGRSGKRPKADVGASKKPDSLTLLRSHIRAGRCDSGRALLLVLDRDAREHGRVEPSDREALDRACELVAQTNPPPKAKAAAAKPAKPAATSKAATKATSKATIDADRAKAEEAAKAASEALY